MSETVVIERMSYGPDAVTHLENGKAVFIEGAAPGDTVEADIVEDRPRFARARVKALVQAGCARAKRASAEPIPGAPWAHLTYEAQLAAKRANLEDALRRVGHLDARRAAQVVQPCVPSKLEWGYRNKIELAAERDDAGRLTLGMREQGGDAFLAVQRMPLANRMIKRAPKALAGALRFCEGAQDLGIYRVGVRASLRTKALEVALWTPPSAFPRSAVAKTLQDAVGATSIVRVIADPGKARIVKRVEALEGQGFWKEDLLGLPDPDERLSYAVSAPSFFQVNTRQAEKLVRFVLDGIRPDEGMRVADLYCGAGTFSLPLACTGAAVAAVESAGSSMRDLRRNADYNGVFLDAVGDDAMRALPSLGCFDAIVVDPPAAGLAKEAARLIADARPRTLMYASCDPQTFARDAARLEREGFRLEQAVPVDMFPQTYHAETVGKFSMF